MDEVVGDMPTLISLGASAGYLAVLADPGGISFAKIGYQAALVIENAY